MFSLTINKVTISLNLNQLLNLPKIQIIWKESGFLDNILISDADLESCQPEALDIFFTYLQVKHIEINHETVGLQVYRLAIYFEVLEITTFFQEILDINTHDNFEKIRRKFHQKLRLNKMLSKKICTTCSLPVSEASLILSHIKQKCQCQKPRNFAPR